MQFKVGDRFKVVNNHPNNPNYEGKIGTVEEVRSPGKYKIKFEGHSSANYWDDDGDMELISNNISAISMDKFYRVKKDLPWVTVGAVLKKVGSNYKLVNDLYTTDAVEEGQDLHFIAYGIEHAPEWFERVYEVSLLTKTVYKLKEEAKELFSKEQEA